MTRKYTAADFANAQFAKHPTGNYALRRQISKTFPWVRATGGREMTDYELADYGWVPVPTKPTITRKSYDEAVEFLGGERDKYAFDYAFRVLGIEIPAPEPTNTDRLEELIISAPGNFEGVEAILKRPANVRAWAEYLNKHGVTAPKEEI